MAKQDANLAIWNVLGKTDPAQTKAFTRGGGFKGTAIKPIYTDEKMTEMFGPCGTGWGFSEPQFQLASGPDGQVAVYCWLSLWYAQGGKRSEPVPGVGGDFVVKKFSSGLSMDDEAFKKAFTDAIGNAMKHLGMSADVHMGRFDDSKYVNERKQEEAAEAAAEQREQAPRDTRPAPAAPQRQAGSISDRAAAPRVSSGPQRQTPPADDNPFAPTEAEISGYVAKFQSDAETCQSIGELDMLWKGATEKRFSLGIGKDHWAFPQLTRIGADRKEAIERSVGERLAS